MDFLLHIYVNYYNIKSNAFQYYKNKKKYYISSLLLDVQLFSYAIRKHWNVENKLHWQMDFTFESDDNTTMNKKALFDLQIIKKIQLKNTKYYKGTKEKKFKKNKKRYFKKCEKELVEIFKLMRNFDISTLDSH